MTALSNVIPMGHNNPPSDVEILLERLKEKNSDLVAHARDLLCSANAAPEECTNEDTAGRLADIIKGLNVCDKTIDGQRTAEKEPFLVGGRAVDGFFNSLRDRIADAKKKIQSVLTVYQSAKAAEERRAREETARLLREEAERKAAEAASIEEMGVSDLAQQHFDAALTSEQQAQKADLSAQAKASELTKARGSQGSVASLRTIWVGELIDRNDLDLNTLRAHLPQDAIEKAINSFIRAGGRELRGAKIYSREGTVVR